jgi:phosphatidylglycerophosphate synthase
MDLTHKWYMKISDYVVAFFLWLGIRPNQITVFNIVMMLTAGVYLFSRGTWQGYAGGFGVCLISGFLDYADGDLAKKTGQVSELGKWLDSGFDVILQNIIMAAIGLGVVKQGVPVVVLALFFVGNTALNFISFRYNATFGFDSYNGNSLFRKYMDEKPTIINRFFKNLIDPTSSGIGLVMFTVRYWIALGAILNIMPLCFIIMTVRATIHWIVMFIIFSFHQCQYKKLWVSQALALIDAEREEFYAIRCGEKV